MHKHTNHLIHETSPYLLQHAHNPVDWYPWGDEALNRAKDENKPILVSIGYSACHWCHVMERESFEDENTAAIMNKYFVNIKIDREERPDLDHIYMDAVQAMVGSGGWPLNVFLTPDARPFYGGTYFPPRRAFNRASWTETLESIHRAYTERRDEVDSQANNLTEYLLQSNSFGNQVIEDQKIFAKETLVAIFDNIMKSADTEWGGFGKAPKFPQTFTIQFLLRYHHITGDVAALQQALLSLDKMIAGGIYDQAGGGFARYSTDTEWLAPHFEKMLYDNALLVSVLSEAYQLTKKPRYREVIEETLGFVSRELLHSQNAGQPGRQGFSAALDADSEGEEGKFYVWSKAEVDELLGGDAGIFCRYFDISERGNWEGKNILRTLVSLDRFAAENDIPIETLRRVIDSGRKKLMQRREGRVRPGLDDKVILGWNALMNTACSKAFMATGNEEYKQLAIDNMNFLLDKFRGAAAGEYFHTWKNEKARYPAFLDDYAFLVQALIALQEITFDTKWLKSAREITEWVISQFEEPGGYFYYTKAGQTDVIVRKKEIYDGAVPSGNSVMAYNLYQLSICFDKPKWKERSLSMIKSAGEIISRYPTSFGVWGCLLAEIISGTYEIAIVGKDHLEMQRELFQQYLPHKLVMGSVIEKDEYPILKGKQAAENTVIYLCKDYVCQQPVSSIKRFMSLINRD